MISWTWILTAITITGAILNSRKRIEGFYFWLLSNIGWLVVAFQKDMYSQAFLWAFYIGICFYGIYQWRKRSGKGN